MVRLLLPGGFYGYFLAYTVKQTLKQNPVMTSSIPNLALICVL